ncbi:MAG: hypothetical protein PVG39_30405 [Desulfobacteraceae bacterium]|jgi:hypothetical protein
MNTNLLNNTQDQLNWLTELDEVNKRTSSDKVTIKLQIAREFDRTDGPEKIRAGMKYALQNVLDQVETVEIGEMNKCSYDNHALMDCHIRIQKDFVEANESRIPAVREVFCQFLECISDGMELWEVTQHFRENSPGPMFYREIDFVAELFELREHANEDDKKIIDELA